MSKKLLIIALAALTYSVVAAADVFKTADAFKTIDADRSGSISTDEATVLPGLTEQWTALDTDANGELSVEEFAKFQVPKVPEPAMNTPTGL